MAWTQSDLDKIDSAIAGNIRSVTFSDGRQVTYQDADKMLQVRGMIKAELLASTTRAGIRATRAMMRRP